MLKLRGFPLEHLGYMSVFNAEIFQELFGQFIEAIQDKK